MTQLVVPGLPDPLDASPGSTWQVDPADGRLRVTAAPLSDIFVDPGAGDGQVKSTTLLNAATLLTDAAEGDFQLSAHGEVEFAATFDAGVLLLWLDERYWAKLCFEYSPAGEAMVVSVVNREVADDANAFVVDRHDFWLRVSRIDNVFAFHASSDGETWVLVRVFGLERPGAALRIGFEAQSPMGDGCAVTFSQTRLRGVRLSDVRDGS